MLLQEDRQEEASHEVGIDVPGSSIPPTASSNGHGVDTLASGSGLLAGGSGLASGSGLLAGGSGHNLLATHSNMSLQSQSSAHQ